MGIVAKADPKTGEMMRVEVPDEDLAQDTKEQADARKAEPKPLSLADRIAALETQVAALTRAAK